MTTRTLVKRAKDVLGGPVHVSHGKHQIWQRPAYFVNVYGPSGRDVRVTAKDKDTAIRACAAALEAMR